MLPSETVDKLLFWNGVRYRIIKVICKGASVFVASSLFWICSYVCRIAGCNEYYITIIRRWLWQLQLSVIYRTVGTVAILNLLSVVSTALCAVSFIPVICTLHDVSRLLMPTSVSHSSHSSRVVCCTRPIYYLYHNSNELKSWKRESGETGKCQNGLVMESRSSLNSRQTSRR